MGLFGSSVVGLAAIIGALYVNNPKQVKDIYTQSGLSCAVADVQSRLAVLQVAVDTKLANVEPSFIILLSFVAFYLIQYFFGDIFAFFTSDQPLLVRLKQVFFRGVRKLPLISSLIRKEVAKNVRGLEKSVVVPLPPGVCVYRHLPEKGMSEKDILARLEVMRSMGDFDKRFKEGKVSGTIYVPSEKHEEYNALLCKAYGMFTWTNPLHMGIFPGVRQMEAEIIRFGCDMFHGGEDSCGSMTSGGTESIMMACKAYRDYAREHRGITHCNAVIPRTAHPAFDKACQYLGISLRRVEEDCVSRKVRVADVESRMDENTAFIVGSCPQYPHGAIDPIEGLSKLALKYGCGMHVDCCLGSFVVPFLGLAPFDFRLRGVTSISTDTHKYGYAPKGSSLVLYASKALHQCQFSVFPDWPGGIYGTPSLAGSRPGALVAATYCAMMSQGVEGYRNAALDIRRITLELAEGIRKIKGIRLMCEPESSVVAWTSDVFNVNLMVDGMIKSKHWDLNVLQFPAAVHICVTRAHTRKGFVHDFIRDLTEATALLVAQPGKKMSEAAAVYGTSQAIPDRSIIEDIVKGYISITYQLPADADADTKDEKKKEKNKN